MIHVLVVLVLSGLALWLMNTYIPMHPAFKTAFNVVIVLALILWLLRAFGVVGRGDL